MKKLLVVLLAGMLVVSVSVVGQEVVEVDGPVEVQSPVFEEIPLLTNMVRETGSKIMDQAIITNMVLPNINNEALSFILPVEFVNKLNTAARETGKDIISRSVVTGTQLSSEFFPPEVQQNIIFYVNKHREQKPNTDILRLIISVNPLGIPEVMAIGGFDTTQDTTQTVR